ncbi:MAG: hypothetical protein HY903_06935 [Deltaproteobacteria bacterium]|nr:hypothetical protein [Deltaproteobacteria bacterium]
MKALRDLGREIADTLGDGPSRERRLRQRQAVAALVRRPARVWWWAGAGFATAAAAAALTLVVVRTQAEPVPFWVGNAAIAGSEGVLLRAPAAEPLPLHFAEGTEVIFTPRSRGQVRAASRGRVQVQVDEGALHASVKPGLRWEFGAGPYRVQVTGTSLTVEWNPTVRQAGVSVSSGAVIVRGPNLPGGSAKIVAGQRLDADLDEGIARLRAVADPTDDADRPADDPTHVAKGKHKVSRRAAHPAGPSWQSIADQGRYADALAAAKLAGLDELTDELDLPDLVRLADVARYARSPDEARQVLGAIGRRFPKSQAGRGVPFLLARVALELDGDPKSAARQLQLYLARNADGELDEEARGRLVEALLKTGDREAACGAAQEYLRRYPRGGYMTLARSACAQ